MILVVRTLALMFVAPPLLLLVWAHFIRPISFDSGLAALGVAGLVGLFGVASAPWSNGIKAGIAVAYLVVAFVGLPFLGLLAVCSTGDCL